MSYFIVYATEDTSDDVPPIDGDHIATGRGWLAWGDWALANQDAMPEAARLAEDGELYPAEALDALESQLDEALHGRHKAPPHVNAITAALLAALRARPDDTVAILISDGTPGGDEGGEGYED